MKNDLEYATRYLDEESREKLREQVDKEVMESLEGYGFRFDEFGSLIIPSSVDKGVKSENPFKPQNLKEYVGQDKAKSLVEIMIKAAQAESRELPNILISGSYGQGKTSLAHLIVKEFGKEAKEVDGASANKLPPTQGRVIIDEAHNLSPEITDTLNIYLDRGILHVIACTTNPGAIPAPFRSRFRPINLEPYSIEDMETILNNSIHRKGYSAKKEQLKQLASRGRFTPRVALNHLALVFDMMAIRRQKSLQDDTLKEAFDHLGVDEVGFLERDRAYLAALRSDRPVGLQYLSAVTGMDGATIEEEVEPYLMKLGLIDRTPRGRMKIVEF